jgi:hypothetical protein
VTDRESANGDAGDLDAIAAGSQVAGAPDRPDAYVISHPLAQATLDYLASRPYREVYQLVRAFEALEPVPTSEA